MSKATHIFVWITIIVSVYYALGVISTYLYVYCGATNLTSLFPSALRLSLVSTFVNVYDGTNFMVLSILYLLSFLPIPLIVALLSSKKQQYPSSDLISACKFWAGLNVISLIVFVITTQSFYNVMAAVIPTLMLFGLQTIMYIFLGTRKPNASVN